MLLGLLGICSLLIILGAFIPGLSDSISKLLYDSAEPVLNQAPAAAVGNSSKSHREQEGTDSQGIERELPESEIIMDKEVWEADREETDREAKDLQKQAESYVYSEPVSGKEGLTGRNGYIPVQEAYEEIDEEEEEKLREKYTYGETGEGLDFDSHFYPYYGMLDDRQKRVYRQIFANAQAVNGSFNPLEPVSVTELKHIFMAVFNDHPGLFWLESSYKGRFSRTGECMEIGLSFYPLIDDLDKAKRQFEEAAEQILTVAQGMGSDVEQEIYVHNALLEKVSYHLSSPYNQSAYSAMVNGESVCAGYARAFQYLMMELSIPCYYCTGYAGESHAWNIIELEGEYYHVDVTWDDAAPEQYDYFNCTDADYASTHRREDLSVYLPACNGTAYGNLATDSAEEEEKTGRSLEEAGYTEEDVLWSLEDYFTDCREQILSHNGSCEFWNVIDNESLWYQCHESYQSDYYLDAYMNEIMTGFGAIGCEIYVEAELLKDGRFLMHHRVVFN